MINIKFINATSVQLVDKNNNVVTTIGEFSGSPIVYTYNGNTFSKNDLEYYHFAITGTNVQLSGVIDEVTTKQQFTNLFKGCTNITDASQLELTASDLTESCYAGMFLNCSNLKTPPVLAATGLAMWCYNSMFAGCSSLSSAPTLPATTLAPYCYYAMFYGCSNLSTSPYLPATTLTSWCYNSMFYNCTSLNEINCSFSAWNGNATSSWVTNVALNGLFINKNAPRNYGVNNIPQNWLAFEVDVKNTPLTLEAVGGRVKIGWYGLYSPSTNRPTFDVSIAYKKNNSGSWWGTMNTVNGQQVWLEEGLSILLTGLNTRFATGGRNGWYFHQYDGTGTVKCYGNIDSILNGGNYIKKPSEQIDDLLPYCFFMLFLDVSVSDAYGLYFPYKKLSNYCFAELLDYKSNNYLTAAPPILPATILAEGCYRKMFLGNKYLTTAPYLPATGLATLCYRSMFNGCSLLTSINVNFTMWNENATSAWVNKVSPTGTFYKPADLPEAFSTSQIPAGWTVINK